ncbi:hypothetical protein JW926_03065 [Candidatus Sumerlaeota bacterium]|nr:hypothetical protein [Candidatus Sumerlaeota bacterium]
MNKIASFLFKCAILCALFFASHARADLAYYVAPSQNKDSYHFLSPSFWNMVQDSLQKHSVTVYFRSGEYSDDALYLENLGNASHQLLLCGETSTGTVFLNTTNKWAIRFIRSRNIRIKHLHFRDNIPNFAIHIQGEPDHLSSEFIIEECSFKNLTNTYYGAIGLHNFVENVTIEKCRFDNVGSSVHAHMLYASQNINGVKVTQCFLKDSMGDYVRFRNKSGNAIVVGNTFESSASQYNRPFIEIPLFNDVNPGDEYFGNGFTIRNNSFNFFPDNNPSDNKNIAIAFENYGFEPDGVRYFLTPDEVESIGASGISSARAILLERTGIDASLINVSDNAYINHREKVIYGSIDLYGSNDNRGWQGRISIYHILDH